MRGLVFLLAICATNAQFFGSTNPFGTNPNVGFNSIFGGGFANPAYRSSSNNLNGLNTAGLTSNGLYGTNGMYSGSSNSGYTTDPNTGLGYASAVTDGRIYNTATCNYLFGSNSVLTFCSRYRQACTEILYNSSVPSNTVRVCGGCTMKFLLDNCNNNALSSLTTTNAAVGK